MSTRRFCTIAAVMAVLAVVPSLALASAPVRAAGPLVDLQLTTSNATDTATARAQVTEHERGSTVTLSVVGLDPAANGQTFGAHVHVGECVAGNGALAGAHYNNGGGISPATEVWLDFTVRGGTGSAVAQVPFVIPPGEAGSIVVHALPTDGGGGAGPRQACLGIDL